MNQKCEKCGTFAVYWDSVRKLVRCHHCMPWGNPHVMIHDLRETRKKFDSSWSYVGETDAGPR
jgi:hypothetical protein